MNLSKEIAAHYREGNEAERLSRGTNQLERVRTEQILARYLPSPPAVVLDVGGAAGVYAIPLAQRAYSVRLIDPMELHVTQAREAAERAGIVVHGGSATAIAAHATVSDPGSSLGSLNVDVGDARRLPAETESADAVLLLGPLYHLVDPGDRALALREACRVLKPRGVVFVAAISRFASLIDGVGKGFLTDPDFQKIVAGDLASGRHENPTNHPHYFTTAYFHRPEELSEEIYAAGFGAVQVLAVEGPVWSGAEFEAVWADPTARTRMLESLEKIEREPSVLGASAHMLAVARRPDRESLVG